MDMDGFADHLELEQYAYRPGAFYLGDIHSDHSRAKAGAAGISDDRHVFITAGSRSGKGTSLIVPNLIHWPGPIFNIDPKGENASLTAMRRGSETAAHGSGTSVQQFIGQKVAILDPMGTVRGPARMYQVSYNPLLEIDLGREDAAARIETITEGLVMPETGSSEHWSESVSTILSGAIEAVLATVPEEARTLPTIRDLVIAGFDPLMAKLEDVHTDAQLAQEALGVLSEAGENERGSFKTTLSRQLKWMAEPAMQRHLQSSAFSLRRAMQEGWSIYVAIPPKMIARKRRWLRMVTSIALDAKTDDTFQHSGWQTLTILDEFPVLGHFPVISEAAGYLAGYGLKLVPVIQNIGQLREHYRSNWETFLGNAGAICGFGFNDFETEEYFSKRFGHVMSWETSYGTNTGDSEGTNVFRQHGTMSTGSSSTTSRRERLIRWPNEIHAETARRTMRMYVIPAEGRPLSIKRRPYTEITAPLYDSPEVITEWEGRYAAAS